MELKELKQKVTSAQESLTIDGDVAKQEEECAWFRSETSRLTIHQDNMQEDMKSMHHRLHTLREQVSYLSDQLKAVMKRSKIMEAELKGIEEARKEGTGSSVGTKSHASNTTKTSSPYNKYAKRKNPPIFSESKLLSLQQSQSRNAFKLNNMATSLNHQVSQDLAEIEENKSIIDIELEDSIKSTLKLILDRRAEEVARSLKSRKAMKEVKLSDMKKLKPHEDGNVDGTGTSVHSSSTKCDDVGLNGLGMSKFTPTDKFAALCHFLAKPAVFEIIVSKLNAEVQSQAEYELQDRQEHLEGIEDQSPSHDEVEIMMKNSISDGNKISDQEEGMYIRGLEAPTPIAETEKFVGFSDSQTVASMEHEVEMGAE